MIFYYDASREVYMKRRDFILKSALFAFTGLLLGSNLIQSAYAVTWAAVGKLGYKEVSSNPGKKCNTCSWFSLDSKVPGSGVCKLVGMKNANGGGDVHVKSEGFCAMWKKKT